MKDVYVYMIVDDELMNDLSVVIKMVLIFLIFMCLKEVG